MTENPCEEIGRKIDEANELCKEYLERVQEYGALYKAGDSDTLDSRMLWIQLVVSWDAPYIWKEVLTSIEESNNAKLS